MENSVAGYVYTLSAEDGRVRYVGKTQRSPQKRLSEHLRNASSLKYPVHFWIMKHGVQNISMDVVSAHETAEELNLAESGLIAALRSQGYNLMNLTNGGDGMLGFKHGAEMRKRLSEVHTGAKRPPRSEEYRMKLSEGRRGKTHSEESREKMRKAHLNQPPRPQAVRDKISAGLTGRAVSQETRAKISDSLSGEKHFAAKLTQQDVEQIISLWHVEPAAALADRFGVSIGTIRSIWSGNSWKNVPRWYK